HHAGTAIGLADLVENLLPTLFHVIDRPDADSSDLFLPADHMFQRGDELDSQPTVCYEHHANHGLSFSLVCAPPDGRPLFWRLSHCSMSRCTRITCCPASRNHAASLSAT